MLFVSLLGSLFSLFALFYPIWKHKITIKQWRKTLHLDEHFIVYNQIFSDANGFTLSKQARAKNDAPEYVYGEIEFNSFIALLSLTKPTKNTVFYDLGSGIGKTVIACAMVFNVKKSCGIELFTDLHATALNRQQQLQQIPHYSKQNIHFINADFLNFNYEDATCIYINATAFFGETWTLINQRLDTLTQCIYVITTSKKLTISSFVLIKKTSVKMTWGIVNAYIHKKL